MPQVHTSTFVASLFFMIVAQNGFAEAYKVVAKIPVGYGPSAVVMSPDGAIAYVLDNENVRVSLIDMKARKALPPVGLNDMAYSIAIAPGGNMLFALMSDAVTPVDTMRRINNPPIRTLLYNPVSIATSADGLYAYTLSADFNEPEVPSTWKGYISRFNLISQKQEADIKVFQSPVAMALTARGFAYVVHGNGALLPVNLVTGKTHRPMGVYNSPVSIAITPDEEWAYIVTQETNTLTPVKLSTRKVLAGIPVGRYPVHVAISSNGQRAFVANYEDKSITPIDLRSRKPLAPIQLDQRPSSLVVTPDGRMLCAIHPDTDEVSVIARSL